MSARHLMAGEYVDSSGPFPVIRRVGEVESPPVQFDIFAAHKARSARDSALAKVEEHALESFKEEAFAALRRFLESNATMHVDDLAPFLPALPGDRRALGPVFLRAVKAGLMTGTDTFRPSTASNSSAKRVWKSLVWRGQP